MIDLSAAEASARRTFRAGCLFALAGAASYGINIVFARMTAKAGITGADIIFYRALTFAPLAGLYLVMRGQAILPERGDFGQVIRFALAAGATAVFYLTSLQFLPIPIAVAIIYTYPLVLLVVTPFVDRVRLPARRWIAGAAAFAGVLLAVGPHLESVSPTGVLCAVAGSLCCAAMFVHGSRLAVDSSVTFFWSQVVAVPIAAVFAFQTVGLSSPAVLLGALLPVAVTIACYFLGFLFQLLAASRISAATAGLLFLLEPVTAIVGGMVVLGEAVTPVQALGMMLVVAALAYDMLPALSGRDRP